MPTDFEELKRQLLQSDEEFRQLATKHHDLDEKLHTYATGTTSPSPNKSKKSPSKNRSCI